MTRKRTILFLGILLALLLVPTVLPYLIGQLLLPFWAYLLYAFFLLVNAETDEMDAFRTSARMLREGMEPVDVSLYIYRDSRADRMGEEKYNIIFFDTADGSRSLVKVVTNLLNGRELELPLPLRIVLRAFRLEGAAYPVYSINNHLHAICSASDGIVRMLDGYYLAVCDGKTGRTADYAEAGTERVAGTDGGRHRAGPERKPV